MLLAKEIGKIIFNFQEAAWPSGKGAGLEFRRSRVQVLPRPRL